MGNFLLTFLSQHHLIFFLGAAFALGLKYPGPGKSAAKEHLDTEWGDFPVVSSLLIIVIFFLSGLRLNTKDILATLTSPVPLLLAMVLILVVTPVLALLPTHVPFGSKEMGVGFAIFLCVPTALTSGPALIAQSAPKATTFALMLTIATNVVGCFTVPFIVKMVLSNNDIHLDAVELAIRLGITVLLPAIAGKALHIIPGMQEVAKDCKTFLIIVTNICLAFIVYCTVAKSADVIAAQPLKRLDYAIAGGGILHVLLWLVNAFVWLMPFEKDVRRAIWLLASEKTLPVALAVLAGFSKRQDLDDGLLLIPCVFAHLSQLVLDSFVVGCWRSTDADQERYAALQEVMVASQQQPARRQDKSRAKPKDDAGRTRSKSRNGASSSSKARSSSRAERDAERDRSRTRTRREEPGRDRSRSRSPPAEERRERRNPLTYNESLESLI